MTEQKDWSSIDPEEQVFVLKKCDEISALLEGINCSSVFYILQSLNAGFVLSQSNQEHARIVAGQFKENLDAYVKAWPHFEGSRTEPAASPSTEP